MNKHSNICHVTYFELIFRQNKYNIHCLLGNDADSYDSSQMRVSSVYSQQVANTQA
jgi:hypothetical protein